MDRTKDALDGISEDERRTMHALLKMRPEPHKAAPKPATPKGEAQRRRRAQERQRATGATCGD